MDIKKLLYVTDLKDQSLSFSHLDGILSLKQMNLEEMVFLQNSPSGDWFKRLSDFEIKSKLLVKKRIFPSNILSIADEEQASLIIVNLDCEAKSSYHGSFIRKLLNKSSVPVLFINDIEKTTDQNEKGIFQHAVFATDWSATAAADKAFRLLTGFKNILGELEIVNVIHKKLTIKNMRDLKEKLKETRKIYLAEQINAEAHIYAGKTSDEILLAAKDYKASIIVIGGKDKKKNIKTKFFRNTSCRVVEKSRLPVLVMP